MENVKFDPQRLPGPNEWGLFMHPDVPCADDEKGLDLAINAMGFESIQLRFDCDAKHENYLRWFGSSSYHTEESMKEIMDAWNPTCPDGDGWILAGKFDTDDEPVALFVRKIQTAAMEVKA